jgi:hypothetical protein
MDGQRFWLLGSVSWGESSLSLFERAVALAILCTSLGIKIPLEHDKFAFNTFFMLNGLELKESITLGLPVLAWSLNLFGTGVPCARDHAASRDTKSVDHDAPAARDDRGGPASLHAALSNSMPQG